MATAEWRAILTFRFVILEDGHISNYGHMMAVWQLTPGGHVLAYDVVGTWELQTSSHELKDIVPALSKAKRVAIVTAHFLE